MKLWPSTTASLFLTTITCLDVVYGVVKLTFSFLSSVTVIPAIPKSTFPVETAVMIESNSISSILSVIPSSSAIACAMLASMPTTLFPS